MATHPVLFLWLITATIARAQTLDWVARFGAAGVPFGSVSTE